MNRITLGHYGSTLWRRALSLSPTAAATHYHVIGVSGHGKSRFLAHLYVSFLKCGYSATLIDPHGDLARLVLSLLIADGYFDKPNAYQKLLYLDIPGAAAQERYMPFNVLRVHGEPSTIADHVMEALHRTWPALAGGAAPRFDNLVQAGVQVLVKHGQPLPRLAWFLMDKTYRDSLLADELNEDLVQFWQQWYDQMPEKLRIEFAESTLSRVNLLTRDPILKYSLSQPGNVLPFRDMIQDGISAIINLAIPGEEAKRLLGSLLTVSAEQGAMSRANIPEEQREGTQLLFVDEFADFATSSESSFNKILSGTRKYGLFLVMAHQTWSQASDRLRGALGNCGIEVVFRLSREDAERSAKMLGHVEPKTVSAVVEEERESVSMNDQWESLVQELQELYPQQAVVSFNTRHRPAWWRRALHLVRPHMFTVKAPDVFNPKIDSARLFEIERYYLRTFFSQKGDVETGLPAPTPPSRIKRV